MTKTQGPMKKVFTTALLTVLATCVVFAKSDPAIVMLWPPENPVVKLTFRQISPAKQLCWAELLCLRCYSPERNEQTNSPEHRSRSISSTRLRFELEKGFFRFPILKPRSQPRSN